jgi:[acyl-carrier-protein] S-malonyltransferase
MAAILGLDAAGVKAICAESEQGQVAEAVNFNTPEQTVIAGHAAAVQRAADTAKLKGAKRSVMLPVSAPFHCSLMKPAAERLRARLAELTLSAPLIPVVNNADVACLADPQQIKDALVRQAASPVRWVETMQAMAQQGISHVYECGPGKVLAGLARRCADGLTGGAMADLAGLEAALAAANA